MAPENAQSGVEYDVIEDANLTLDEKTKKEIIRYRKVVNECIKQHDFEGTFDAILECNDWLSWRYVFDGEMYEKYRYHLKVNECGEFQVWQDYNTPKWEEVDTDIRRARNGNK